MAKGKMVFETGTPMGDVEKDAEKMTAFSDERNAASCAQTA